MKAKRVAFHAISTLVLGITVLAYIMAPIVEMLFRRGLLSLFTVLIAELEICACVRYFVFEQMGNPSEAKFRRTDLICGAVLWGSTLVQMLGNTLCANGTLLQWSAFYNIGGFILFEPLQGGIMLLLGIRGFKRKRMENEEVTGSIACRILNAVASAVFVLVSIPHLLLIPQLCIIALFASIR